MNWCYLSKVIRIILISSLGVPIIAWGAQKRCEQVLADLAGVQTGSVDDVSRYIAKNALNPKRWISKKGQSKVRIDLESTQILSKIQQSIRERLIEFEQARQQLLANPSRTPKSPSSAPLGTIGQLNFLIGLCKTVLMEPLPNKWIEANRMDDLVQLQALIASFRADHFLTHLPKGTLRQLMAKIPEVTSSEFDPSTMVIATEILRKKYEANLLELQTNRKYFSWLYNFGAPRWSVVNRATARGIGIASTGSRDQVMVDKFLVDQLENVVGHDLAAHTLQIQRSWRLLFFWYMGEGLSLEVDGKTYTRADLSEPEVILLFVGGVSHLWDKGKDESFIYENGQLKYEREDDTFTHHYQEFLTNIRQFSDFLFSRFSEQDNQTQEDLEYVFFVLTHEKGLPPLKPVFREALLAADPKTMSSGRISQLSVREEVYLAIDRVGTISLRQTHGKVLTGRLDNALNLLRTWTDEYQP